MFTSHDPESVAQLKRVAEWLEKKVAQAEANDPELVRLKQAEQVASAKINSSLPVDEAAKLVQAHNLTVSALIRYVSSK